MVPARFRLSARLGAGLSVLALLGGPVAALAQGATPVPALAVPVAVPPASVPAQEPAKSSEPAKTPEPRPGEPAKISEAKAAEPAKRTREPAPLIYAKVSTDPTPTLTARTFLDTLKVADRYAAFAEAGGWERLPDDLIRLKPGERSPAIPSLRHHLTLTGDLPVDAPPSDRLDPPLVAAIAAFQGRHGLPDSGILGRLTINALNVPAATRQRQLAASAARLMGSKFPFGERYVVVNIPSANVEAVENGAVARRYVAVVGSPDKATPPVETRITDINFNPTWTVPASVVKNEIIPQMRKNPGYLTRNHIRILGPTGEVDPTKIDWAGNKAAAYTLRQDSGFDNSLGQVRIDMPNRFAVYMHDTPAKSLFAANVRFHSHGCVRVGQVKELVGWLLQGTDGPNGPGTSWGPIEIETGIADGERRDIKLVKPVPVTFVYLTGYATPDGTAHFRDDIYNLDTPAAEPAATGAIPPAGAAQPAATPKSAAVKLAAPKPAVTKPAPAKPAASKAVVAKTATEGLNPETPQTSR
ncbi:L,D-transpeptidase family protein [Methylobacterium sp. J-048]|uniref:L,D-transpeptidase family protein n=1 Tax=Methylobacterium sp. J-048 TaxID=2836635 RepID=UPI001FB9F655|nr:L,D-transpeptidase family protein [Methylobacterium sp. J-048]MCJ2055286.1 L,D-transpeptidase family protein [Methylobacterium sp. J-048]